MAENPIYEEKNITFFINKDTFKDIPNPVTKIIVRYKNVYSLPPTIPERPISDIKNNNDPLEYVFFEPDNDKRLSDYQQTEARKIEDTEGDSSDDYNKERIEVNFKNNTGEEISGDSMITLTHPIFLNKITIQNPYKSIGRNETVRLHLRGTIDTENPGNNSVKFPNFQVESNNIDRFIALIELKKKDDILEHFTLEDIRKNIIHFENDANLVKDPLASLLDTYKLAKSLGLTTYEFPDVTFAEKEQFFIKNLQRKRIYYEKNRIIEQYINQDNLKEGNKSIIDVNGNEIIHKFDDKYFIYVLNSTMCLPKELKYNEKYGLIYSNFDGNIDRIDVTSNLFNYQKLDNDIIYRLKMTGLNGQESNSDIHVLTLDKLKKINEDVEKWRVYLTSNASNTSNSNVEINNELKMITKNKLVKIHPKILDNNNELNVINSDIHGEIKIPDELYWEITWHTPSHVGGEIMMIGGGITLGQKREIYDIMNEILNNIDDDVKNKTDDDLKKYYENYITKLKKIKNFENIDRHHKKGAWKGSSIKGLIDLFIKLNNINDVIKKRKMLKKIKKKANELKNEFYVKELLAIQNKEATSDKQINMVLKEMYNYSHDNYKKYIKEEKLRFNINKSNYSGLILNKFGQTKNNHARMLNHKPILVNALIFIDQQKVLFKNKKFQSHLNNKRTKKDLFRWISEWINNENPERKGMEYIKSLNIASGNYVDKLLKSLKNLIQEINKDNPDDIPEKMFKYIKNINKAIFYTKTNKEIEDEYKKVLEKFQYNLTKLSENILNKDNTLKIKDEKDGDVMNELKKIPQEYHYLFDYIDIFRDADETVVDTAMDNNSETVDTAMAVALSVAMDNNSGTVDTAMDNNSETVVDTAMDNNSETVVDTAMAVALSVAMANNSETL